MGRRGVEDGGKNHFPWAVSCFYSPYGGDFLFSSFLVVRDRPGGGRGGYHGPPADCERRGLYIISP